MIRLLVKKQLVEIFRGYLYNAKKNKARSPKATTAMIAGFILLTLLLSGGMFGMLAYTLAGPFCAVGMDWLLFLILGLLALVFGCFGSVFNTFHGLYLASDNDLLLSMPIPVRAILISRLTATWLMSLLYSGMVTIPTVIVYWITVGPTVSNVLGGLIFCLLVSLVVLVLACVMGWAVAKLSLKLKNKSYVTVLLAVLGFALYYFVYFKANSLIRDLLRNAAAYGQRIRGASSLLYGFGKAGTGSWAELLIFAAVAAALCALTFWVLARSFLQIATASRAVARVKTRAGKTVQRTPDAALLGKEFRRLGASANYMLNSGFGVLMIPAFGIAMVVFRNDIRGVLSVMAGENWLEIALVILCTLAASMTSMVDTAAPSVSLEAKTLWLVKSLPVTPWQTLRAKLREQLLLSGVTNLILLICMQIAFPFEPIQRLTLALFVLAFNALTGIGAMALSIRLPNLAWTNETYVLKQSAPVTIMVLGGFAAAGVLAGLYFLLKPDAVVYLCVWIAVCAAAALYLWYWLKTRGAKRLEDL